MDRLKTGNEKRKHAYNRYEDIDNILIGKLCNCRDEKRPPNGDLTNNIVYWLRRLRKERAYYRRKYYSTLRESVPNKRNRDIIIKELEKETRCNCIRNTFCYNFIYRGVWQFDIHNVGNGKKGTNLWMLYIFHNNIAFTPKALNLINELIESLTNEQ